MKESNKKKSGQATLSAVRRANDYLVARNLEPVRLESRTFAGNVVIRTIYSGRQYEVNLSPSKINEAYAKSVKSSK